MNKTNKYLFNLYYIGISLLFFLLTGLIIKIICEVGLKIEVFSVIGLLITSWYSLWFINFLIVYTYLFVYIEYINESQIKDNIDLIVKIIFIYFIPLTYLLINTRELTSKIFRRFNELINY
jgi:hypothetical protein